MLSSNLLKSKIPMLGGGGASWNFDAEFKFAKIQNSHVGGGGGTCGNLLLSSNLLKSKIAMSWGGGGGWGCWWNQFSTSDAESKFALKKKKKICEKFSKFLGKNWNGFVLDFEYQVVPLYEV